MALRIGKTCFLVVLLALTVAVTAVGQTPLTGQLNARPMTNDDIAAYKLPSTTQRAGGLTTVGLGEPVYLDALVNINVPSANISNITWAITAKPASSAALLADSPLDAAVPAYEPSDQLVYQVAGRKMFKPDVAGPYTITATILSTKGETLVETINITGATFVGINTCSKCHSGGFAPAKVAPWSKTGHASIFQKGLDGIASDHYNQACLGCHTVGYDTDPGSLASGGFYSIAAALKWTFPATLQAGNYNALPAELKNLGNIQCENCHGPGSQHATTANKALISVSQQSGACGQCHGAAKNHIKTGEWLNSRHAVVTRDPSGAGREVCVGCHTGTGFQDRLKNVATPNTAYSPINCQTCHDPHGETSPATNTHLVRTLDAVTLADGTKVTSGGSGKLCMNCHQSRQNANVYAATTPGSTYFGPHHGPQADMLAGVNGFTYGLDIPSSAHGDVVADSCVTCHMQTVASTNPALGTVGGHTFKIQTMTSTGDKLQMVAACQTCHGPDVSTFDFRLFDYNNDGVVEGVQTEVQRLLDQLALMLPPVGVAKTSLTIDSTWTQPQLEAAYNYLYVSNDGSKGVHNTAYAVGLLKASIARVGN